MKYYLFIYIILNKKTCNHQNVPHTLLSATSWPLMSAANYPRTGLGYKRYSCFCVLPGFSCFFGFKSDYV